MPRVFFAPKTKHPSPAKRRVDILSTKSIPRRVDILSTNSIWKLPNTPHPHPAPSLPP
ncbi:MAG: hypothetical protein JWL81_1012 [Verrucomicrobiales bacterium]|nr:hypothetical protein [Verrucomicrobiales bacterium]